MLIFYMWINVSTSLNSRFIGYMIDVQSFHHVVKTSIGEYPSCTARQFFVETTTQILQGAAIGLVSPITFSDLFFSIISFFLFLNKIFD